MSVFTGPSQINPGIPYVVDDATPQAVLGQEMYTADGRKFRYALAGGTSLVAGTLLQAAAEDTADQNITPTAAAIGDTSLVTTTTMTVTANQYAGGYMIVTVTPGVGIQYAIKSHVAYTAAAATFELEDPIQVALTTTSRVDFVTNPYSNVIIFPTTQTSAPVGVAVNNVTNARYGWVQVGGVATVLADGANAVGATLVASNAVAGAVEDAASPGAQPFIGWSLTGVADTEYGAVLLSLR